MDTLRKTHRIITYRNTIEDLRGTIDILKSAYRYT
nr:MAG TPA: hypothetical protein [Caudoviricetes sp.]